MRRLQPAQDKSALWFVISTLLIVSAFGVGVIMGGGLNGQPASELLPTEGFAYDANYLNEVYAKIEEQYLGDLPDTATLTRSMAKGMVDALGDEYSAFLDPVETESYFESNASTFEGIGVQLGFDGSYTTVDTPLDGFPGQQAGLQTGDQILEVDGVDVAGKRPEVVATMIRGEAGTDVTLTLYRDSDQRVFDVTITRDKIDLDNITYKMLDGGITLIDIVKFTEGEESGRSGAQVFESDWDAIVTQVVAQNPQGIIVDLRNNPGGYVEAVKYVAEEFLSDGQIILQEQSKGGIVEKFIDERTGEFEQIPMVVLVNEGSASASEIFAGAIQDNDRGKIVGGEHTVGKGVEQRLLTLSDNSILMLVFKRWLTAGGRQLSKDSSITPDEVIILNEDNTKNDQDPQLSKALELLGAN
ncbi:S41 family peptidase [Candidatus Dojkabacteria bacterium]|uniref:S41 family peptidase n=1 Tax=Candidatus Dojkabacteria bacterium TaxID=2099670 RepID=A0A955L0C7_9BACT|nr:S41 family peptidase [Candidatus Dojkabacteria bacterium]